MTTMATDYHSRTLPVNDLDMHILEAIPPATAHPEAQAPLIILLHGFPELAYSWRKILAPLCAAGYHVVAPDQRGYGATTPRATTAPTTYTSDLAPFRMLNLTADIVALVHALGHTTAAAIIGHDFGSILAGHCALIRPDIFRSVVLMSAPYTGAPSPSLVPGLADALAGLTPPRKHYSMYFSSPAANADMSDAPQGLRAFLRQYFHAKSGDVAPTPVPHALPDLSAASLAQLPLYYVMHLHETMPETAQHSAPAGASPWLTDAELDVYTAAYARTGFQGGLNRYRCLTDARWSADLAVFARKTVDVPAMFVAGRKDWGVHQLPGALERMREVCTRLRGEDVVLVEGAGHWVQQENPRAVLECLIGFLKRQEGEEV